jgi:hypothetical protein
VSARPTAWQRNVIDDTSDLLPTGWRASTCQRDAVALCDGTSFGRMVLVMSAPEGGYKAHAYLAGGANPSWSSDAHSASRVATMAALAWMGYPMRERCAYPDCRARDTHVVPVRLDGGSQSRCPQHTPGPGEVAASHWDTNRAIARRIAGTYTTDEQAAGLPDLEA